MRFWTSFYLLACIVVCVAADPTITVTNNCGGTIWPAMADIGGRTGTFQGWEASPGFSKTLNVEGNFVGRIWARQECTTMSNGTFACATADCGSLTCSSLSESFFPNVTVAQFSLNGQPNNFYGVDITRGFDLPMQLTTDLCPEVSCPANFTATCPKELQGPIGTNGAPLSCLSSCTATIGDADEQTQNCGGSGLFGSSNSRGEDYFNWFNSGCPAGLNDTTPSCNKNPTKYTVTFCPENTVNIAAPINEFSPASTFTTLPTSSAAISTSSRSSTLTPGTSAKASTTASTTHSATSAPQSGLSAGVIAGIVIGVIILLVGLGLGALLLWRRRRRHASASTSVPIEQYVRPYEAALAPARPVSEKTAVFLPGSSVRKPSGSSAGNASSSSAATPSAAGPEAEDRFEERFQNRLMQFLRTNMDPPHVAGEALPSYPGPSNV